MSPAVFTEEAVMASDIRALMARIVSSPHPSADMSSSEHFLLTWRST
ncbi:hypothetical protein HED49_19715 [Ochrobactrum daejeonense]|nr:hypothetical protein [Brucella daejeonensis]